MEQSSEADVEQWTPSQQQQLTDDLERHLLAREAALDKAREPVLYTYEGGLNYPGDPLRWSADWRLYLPDTDPRRHEQMRTIDSEETLCSLEIAVRISPRP